MPTVIAADEAFSSCSQNAAYNATIMAAQIRSAKAQAERGKPATLTVRRSLCTRVTVNRERMRRAFLRTIGQPPLTIRRNSKAA
ncbi:MAG TPA: hypothetical protein VE684_01915 [Crenalkalicoccus sp.]|nr:hypothetical protein [Crenalkalicoccus sp.]